MLVLGDIHIQEKNINELEGVFEEILSLASPQETIICLGDYYHNSRPTTKEIKFGTKWAKKFVDIGKFILLIGNHPTISPELSSVDYLKELGVKLYKEFVNDNIYFGHKETEKSDMYFGRTSYDDEYFIHTLKLKEFKLSFLGHQHAYQQLTDNIYHLGSVIFTSFNEIGVKEKYVAIIDKGTTTLFPIKSVIPIYEVFNIAELNGLPIKAKVRYTIRSFEQFTKEINEIQKYKKRFYLFKIKLDFVKHSLKIEKKNNNLKEVIEKWLSSIKNEKVKTILENEIKTTNII